MPKDSKKDGRAEDIKSESAAEDETAAAESEAEAAEEDERGKKIKKLEEELAAQKDKYMRLCAEYDNYRKRTSNEKLTIYDDATAKAVSELLPVADSMRMALENLKDADAEVVKGMELVSNQLEKAFKKLNIESFGEVGEGFDPELHNAISKVEDESLGENTIAQVFQTGYKRGDKIVRHAMVQVANCG